MANLRIEFMNPEPRHREEYSQRQVEAAHRVLIDVGQVLASFEDCMVVIGGWVPDLLLTDADESHIGSIDVDLALDATKLNDGRYAELLQLLLNTQRYRRGAKDFQLIVTVDLDDGDIPVEVELEFLAPREVKLKKRKPKLIEGFRVLRADGCAAAFNAPQQIELSGKMVKGPINTVRLRVASVADFLVMKAHALSGRDKPKDSYDLCYCLDHFPKGIGHLAQVWKARIADSDVTRAITILREKFSSVDAFGPQQFAEFHEAQNDDTRDMLARRSYELVAQFLSYF